MQPFIHLYSSNHMKNSKIILTNQIIALGFGFDMLVFYWTIDNINSGVTPYVMPLAVSQLKKRKQDFAKPDQCISQNKSQVLHGYVPLVVKTSRSRPHSWLIIGFATRLTQRMPPVEQKRFTLPDHLRSSPVVTRSLVVGVCFEDHCLSICLFLAAIVLSVLL